MMADSEDASVQRAHAADVTPASAEDAVLEDAGHVPPRDLSAPEPFTRSIVRTKVQPPPVRDATLERPRLLQWLTDHASDRLVLICAEAGYGKTTLLADFARRSSFDCLWVRVEATDGDWVSFLNYLVAAIREIQPDFGAKTASLLAQIATANVTLPVVLDAFISELPTVQGGPTMLILDDFHIVDDSKDVHTILARILDFAPSNISVLIASRTPLTMHLGRLTAHGQVSRLITDDLRFSTDETADLFARSYQLPLEPDLVTEIDARAEGWAASLQLVYSSIRERQPSEARAFIFSLSGVSEALYDYLAEEVLAGLSDQLRRVLTRASLLDRIVPAYVLAILSVESDAPSPDELGGLLDEADRLGLMGRTAVGAAVKRFHPLLRTFLEHELNASSTAELRQQMHLAVAEAAEGDDWITASDHYISADHLGEAMRVIGNSATSALGNGDFDSVVRLVARVPDVELPLAVQAVRARALLASDGERAAIDLLESLDLSNATDYERSIVALAKAAAFYAAGALDEWRKATTEVLRLSPALPESIIELVSIWTELVDDGRTRSLGDMASSLNELGQRQIRVGHHYHAAISFHNAMIYALLLGDFAMALQLGDKAIDSFRSISGSRNEYASTLMTVATALFETGADERAIALADAISAVHDAHADAYADAAFMQVVTGHSATAATLLEHAAKALSRGQGDPGARFSVANSLAYVAIASGKPEDALFILSSAPEQGLPDPDVAIRRALTICLAHLLIDDGLASDQLTIANDLVRAAGAQRYRSRLAILDRVISDDWNAAARLVDELGSERQVVVLELAEALLPVLAMTEVIPETIGRSIADYPDRWIPLARRQLPRGQHSTARAAARVLSEYGTADDLPRVTAYERTYVKSDRSHSLARRLIVRTSPRLAVHDLGRVRFELAGRTTAAAHTRRKASALLAYLITCPNQTATKEQVVEGLWPDLDGKSGVNSFNQTLYFLRRDVDQWYQPPTSPEYVVNEAELVWLDRDIVEVESVRFYELAQAIRVDAAGDAALEICRRYTGRFAPEFEYEQWSIGWRDRLHALYLSLVHGTVVALANQGQLQDARSLLLAAAAIDPEAMDLDPSLIWVYDRLGSRSAAVEQYRRYAAACRLELGELPTSFDTIRTWGSPSG